MYSREKEAPYACIYLNERLKRVLLFNIVASLRAKRRAHSFANKNTNGNLPVSNNTILYCVLYVLCGNIFRYNKNISLDLLNVRNFGRWPTA